MTTQERMHLLLENIMAQRPLRCLTDETLQVQASRLPLAALYLDEADETLVVGMTCASRSDQERHKETLDRLSHLIGGQSGVPHRLTYLNVYRDFKLSRSGDSGNFWNDGNDGNDGDGGGDSEPRRGATATTAQTLRGGISLGCAGTLCLIYSLGRSQQAAILSSHAVGSATGAKIFGARESGTSRRGGIVDALSESKEKGNAAEVIAIVTVNPSLQVRASDASLALLTNQRVLGIDHSIRQASDREFHVTSYVSSIETPLETKVGMRSPGNAKAGRTRGATTWGHIRHKGCSLRDDWGTLTDQVLTDYAAHPGDSGAPVFIAGRGADEVGFVGIHAGRIVEESGRAFSFYSTWEAIKSELQLPAPRW